MPANVSSEGTLRLLGEELVEFEVEFEGAEVGLSGTGHTKLLSASVPEELYCTNDTLVPAVLAVIQDWK